MFNTLPLLLTAAAAAAATAAIAYAATAKRRISITEEEATILWKIHKQTSNCKSRNMQPIVYGRGEIAGFSCQCGYRYIQKKPLLSRKIQSNLIT